MEFENIGNAPLSIDYLQNFISKEKQDEIFLFFTKELIKCGLVSPIKSIQKNQCRNNVVRYGTKVTYPINYFDSVIPDILKNILPQIEFKSVTITEYAPGQSIIHDIESTSEKIYLLSICSSSILTFTSKDEPSEIIEFELEQMSLSTINAEIRHNYTHTLTTNNYFISIVFE